MKKKVFGKKLSRDRGSREALFRSVIRALILSGTIRTTKAKAKSVVRDLEKIVTLGKKGTVDARRRVYAILGNDRKATDLLFTKVVPAFSTKTSGFVRIINLPERLGDRAQMSILTWSEKIVMEEKKIKKAEEKSKKETKTKEKEIKGKKDKKEVKK